MSPDQEAEILHLMRRARERDRGYASFFGWAIDRDLEELGVVRALAESLATDGRLVFNELKSRGRGQDPPDVEGLSQAGHRVAFEVTELVDGRAIEAFKAGRHYDYADWDRNKFLVSLRVRLQSKVDRLPKLKDGPYEGGYVIVIHTDEPALPVETVASFLLGQSFHELSGAVSAFLLLSYDPKAGHCPYFCLAPGT
ncbi:MAG: hypothetical protein ABI648_09395 [Betaproteobacteria bacterium]|jgi:hypothetical protein